jgi:hypothetical protein
MTPNSPKPCCARRRIFFESHHYTALSPRCIWIVMNPPNMTYMSWEFRYMSYKLSNFSWGLSHELSSHSCIFRRLRARGGCKSSVAYCTMFYCGLVQFRYHLLSFVSARRHRTHYEKVGMAGKSLLGRESVPFSIMKVHIFLPRRFVPVSDQDIRLEWLFFCIKTFFEGGAAIITVFF